MMRSKRGVVKARAVIVQNVAKENREEKVREKTAEKETRDHGRNKAEKEKAACTDTSGDSGYRKKMSGKENLCRLFSNMSQKH